MKAAASGMAVACAAAIAMSGEASAGPAPDDAGLVALRAASRHHFAIVWCRDGRFELPGPRFDSTGVWSTHTAVYRGPRVALVETADAVKFHAPPKPIPWPTIDSIAVARRPAGPLVAFTVTALLGVAFAVPVLSAVLSSHDVSTGTALATVGLPIAVVGGLTAATLAGHDRTRVVWRAER